MRTDPSQPSFEDTLFLRAKEALAQGQAELAARLCRECLSLDGNRPEVHHLLGMALVQLGQLPEGVAHLEGAVRLHPEGVVFRRSLGGAYCQFGQFEKGQGEFEAWSRLEPENPEAWHELGRVRLALSELDEALLAFGRGAGIDPQKVSAWLSMGQILKDLGRIGEALDAFRKAEALLPGHPGVASSRLYAMHFLPEITDDQLVSEHDQWSRNLKIQQGDRDFKHLTRKADRPLKVGFVSPDFLDHCQAYFTLPLLEGLDRSQFQVHCYSNVQAPDEVTAAFHRVADVWRDISHLSDPQAEALIRADRLDVLVDLTLHMDGNRLPLFARKPAPVQITYLGYPSTTGLKAMDFRITDPFLDPPDLPCRPFVEQPLYLPNTYWCYRPPAQARIAPKSPFGSAPIRFGSFNNPSKINEPTLDLWSAVLKAVPGSNLTLLAEGESHHTRIQQSMAKGGVASNRISFMDRMSPELYYESFRSVDIILDTYPVNGHTTTLDALWMGVPVVSLAGRGSLSRGGLSILTNVGLSELVASSPEDFVKAAVALAGDSDRLSQLHSTLRGRMKASPLMDEATFARDFGLLLRRCWGEKRKR